MANDFNVLNYINILKKAESKIDCLLNFTVKKNDSKLSEQMRLLSSISLLLKNEINYFTTFNNENEDKQKANIQYNQYLSRRINDISNKCDYIIKYVSEKNPYELEMNYMNSVLNAFGNQSELLLFEQFKYGNSNYILFGKNGSGKTTILNMLAKRVFSTNSVVAKATRNINYQYDTLVHPHNISLKGAIESSNESAMSILAQLVFKKEMEQRRARIDESLVITNRIKEIFNSLGTERYFSITSSGALELMSEKSKSYSLSNGSDGEKSALFLIMLVLLSPENSFVFIDEPENHLNGSLMKKLFDQLEAERKDLVFVYATHNIGFIETRNNAKLVCLKKGEDNTSWSFIKYDDFKNLSLDIVLNVDGLNDDVVFCEGEDKNSYDYKILNLILSGYQIIPSQGCTKVILQTQIFNDNSTILRKKAYGIIDCDFYDRREELELNGKNVYVLTVNEVENLFLCEECIKEMIALLSLPQTVNELIGSIMKVANKKYDAIKKDYATKLLRDLHLKNKLDSVENIEKEIDKLNSYNKALFLERIKVFDDIFKKSLATSDYSTFLRIVPGKMVLKEVAKLFGFLSEKEYIKQLLIRLSQNDSLCNQLRNYISNFPFKTLGDE